MTTKLGLLEVALMAIDGVTYLIHLRNMGASNHY